MNDVPQSPFPLFNRIAVFIMSSGMLVGLLVALASPKFRQDLNVVMLLVLVVFMGMACFGIWISLSYRARVPDVEDEPSAVRPYSEDALVCRFAALNRVHSVVVDRAAGMIHFAHCHTPQRFLARAEPRYSCLLTDIQAAHVRGNSLTIVTKAGNAYVPAYTENYAELSEFLAAYVPPEQDEHDTDHPLMGWVYTFSAIGGLLLGAALTPRQASAATLSLCAAVGAAGMLVLTRLGVWFAYRYLGVSLVRPLGYAAVGAGIGLIAAPLVGEAAGEWTPGLMIVLGAASGLLAGVVRQVRGRRRDS